MTSYQLLDLVSVLIDVRIKRDPQCCRKQNVKTKIIERKIYLTNSKQY
jgi:hypothetical protein